MTQEPVAMEGTEFLDTRSALKLWGMTRSRALRLAGPAVILARRLIAGRKD
jgi:hypothetical protein